MILFTVLVMLKIDSRFNGTIVGVGLEIQEPVYVKYGEGGAILSRVG